MIKNAKEYHILSQSPNSSLFPVLQRRIVLSLAESDPQTINETVKTLEGSYKSTWIAFNSLERKKMIEKVATKNYRNQEYACYWLTPDGALSALLEGAPQPILYEKSIKVYPQDRNLRFLLEIIPVLGTGFLKIAIGSFLAKGRIDDADITIILTSQVNTGLTRQQKKQLAAILKKYPEQYKRLNDTIKKVRHALDELDSQFGSSET